jgi:hypothetical protein
MVAKDGRRNILIKWLKSRVFLRVVELIGHRQALAEISYLQAKIRNLYGKILRLRSELYESSHKQTAGWMGKLVGQLNANVQHNILIIQWYIIVGAHPPLGTTPHDTWRNQAIPLG